MQHIAIMKKSWKLTEKILDGRKKIESRWYMNKYRPWDKIKAGDAVFFKEGKFVSVKAEVDKVLQFSDLNPEKVREILDEYYKEDGIEEAEKEKFFELFKRKKYCMLIFLKSPEKTELFEINKKGFGNMAAWICVEDVSKIIKNKGGLI